MAAIEVFCQEIMEAKPNYANENQSFLNITSNSRKNHFQHTDAKYQVLTTVPSKKCCNSVKISNILKKMFLGHVTYAKPLYTRTKDFNLCFLSIKTVKKQGK